MKITALEEYGLRCLLQVAQTRNDGLATIPEIAHNERLSIQYVSKIMNKLRKGGLVASVRGSKGGYRLTRPAENINLLEVQRALDQKLFNKAFCEKHAGQIPICIHIRGCSFRPLWGLLTKQLEGLLHEAKLAHLVGEEKGVREKLISQFKKQLDSQSEGKDLVTKEAV